MEKLTKTQIKYALKRKELRARHQKIQELVSISDLDYKHQICDYGLMFLDQTFPDDKKAILAIAGCKSYWVWWISEWNNFEKELLQFIQDHQPEVTLKSWRDELASLVGDHITEQGFKNYLKLFHNVRI